MQAIGTTLLLEAIIPLFFFSRLNFYMSIFDKNIWKSYLAI